MKSLHRFEVKVTHVIKVMKQDARENERLLRFRGRRSTVHERLCSGPRRTP